MKDGKEEVYNAKWVASTLAAARAMEELGQTAESAAKTLSDMEGRVG
jgi:hypothetical protein